MHSKYVIGLAVFTALFSLGATVSTIIRVVDTEILVEHLNREIGDQHYRIWCLENPGDNLPADCP